MEKLFTTEDKFDIFPGESWYYVKIKKDGTCQPQFRKTDTTSYQGDYHVKKEVVRFKMVKNAEEYIALHKATFSRDQVNQMIIEYKEMVIYLLKEQRKLKQK